MVGKPEVNNPSQLVKNPHYTHRLGSERYFGCTAASVTPNSFRYTNHLLELWMSNRRKLCGTGCSHQLGRQFQAIEVQRELA
jgi:hypothetical protein